MSRPLRTGIAVLLVAVALAGCAQGNGFSGRRALSYTRRLVRMGPRYVGSEGHAKAAEYIVEQLQQNGWAVEQDCFAYRGEPLCNIIAKRGSGPIVLVGSHYDTRPLADRDAVDRTAPVPGANDGGSGVGVLLELARALDAEVTDGSEIWLVFFDGEDRGDLGGWEWCVGADHLAQRLTTEPANRVEYAIVVDMIGDADQQIYYEWSSALWLSEQLWAVASDLGHGEAFVAEYRHNILDDHTPFLKTGTPAVLLIDFDYPYWHTQQDTMQRLSRDSLQRVGDVLETWLEGEPLATRAIAP